MHDTGASGSTPRQFQDLTGRTMTLNLKSCDTRRIRRRLVPVRASSSPRFPTGMSLLAIRVERKKEVVSALDHVVDTVCTIELLGLLVPLRFAACSCWEATAMRTRFGSAAGSAGVPGSQRAVLESRAMESSLRMRPDVFDPALVAVVANAHALAKLGDLFQHFFVVGN